MNQYNYQALYIEIALIALAVFAALIFLLFVIREITTRSVKNFHKTFKTIQTIIPRKPIIPGYDEMSTKSKTPSKSTRSLFKKNIKAKSI